MTPLFCWFTLLEMYSRKKLCNPFRSVNSVYFGTLLVYILSKPLELFCCRTSIHNQFCCYIPWHDHHASSCLVTVPAFIIIFLADRYFPSQVQYLLLYSKLFLSLVVSLQAVLLLDSELFLSRVASLQTILSLQRYSTSCLLLITLLRAEVLLSYFLG